MTSPSDPGDPWRGHDVGLLSPVRVGSPAEAATGDTAFLQAMLDAEAALTRAQTTLGLAPAGAGAAVTAAARAGRFDARDLALRARAGGNPVIPLVADLTAAVPAAARPWVHRGATSQDILDTAAVLVAHRTLRHLLDDLDRTAAALAGLAAAHRANPLPGRTLTQHAVPTTFGLKAAGWRSLALDARDRLAAVRDRLPAQLGGAAGTLAAFQALGGSSDDALALVDAFAAEMGLAAPALPWQVLRTPIADLGCALALTAGALGKFAADVLLLSRTETAELAESGGGGSSAMPHKANPVRAALIAATARQLPALAGVLLGSLAAEDERPAGAWHAEWQTLREALRLTGGAARAAAELAEGLRVFPERMRADLDLTDGLIVSERLAARLTELLGRSPARQLLAEASRARAERGIPLRRTLADSSPLTDHQLNDLLDPAAYLGSATALTDRALRRTPAPQDAP
ncbi:3-carboxy-cis,cis-muconate cycloisomerase [Streptacidiphilus sp. P02-A3a]|uniref:3-carboxy-cis,cis-muconate cycloisomerase n=1 Tax=Streptacidiphilus sp. P02-A3a TaxID=2704468 RepID=UPI001CDBFAFC|nr:3-carboxy-cis,cis-muconate cycloisomerase [Streptacidiphilus sp. P02-A3a]